MKPNILIGTFELIRGIVIAVFVIIPTTLVWLIDNNTWKNTYEEILFDWLR